MLSASLEVRSSIIYATFIVALVWIPVFFLSGLQGRLFAPLGYAYVLAVMASLVVALTVTPALAMILLPRASRAVEPPLLSWLKSGYERLIRFLNRFFLPLAACAVIFIVVIAVSFFRLGGEFLPQLRENHFVVHMAGLPGTSLAQSMATGKHLMRELQRFGEVRSVAQQAGRAELGEDTFGVEYSELEVDLKPTGGQAVAKLQQNMKTMLDTEGPGFFFEVMPFLSERIEETMSGSTAPVAVKLYGNDLDKLEQWAKQVKSILGQVRGNDNVQVEHQTGAPEIVVRPRRDAGPYGVQNGIILDTLHTAYQGAEVGQAYDSNRTIGLVVKLDPRLHGNLDNIPNLWIFSASAPRSAGSETTSESGRAASAPAGRIGSPPFSVGRTQLKQVASIFPAEGRILIAHEEGTRRQLVTCYVKDRDVESFVTEAERQLKKRLPENIDYRIEGDYLAKQTMQHELLLLSLLAAAGVLLILGLVYRSPRNLILILANLPFALVGGVLAVHLRGGILNVGALVGFVTLFGITTRNSIMMFSHWQHLHDVEGMTWVLNWCFAGLGAPGAGDDDSAGGCVGIAADRSWQRRGRPRD